MPCFDILEVMYNGYQFIQVHWSIIFETIYFFHICRFHIKLDVEDDIGRAVFVLYDDLIKTIVAESCEVLSKMVNFVLCSCA